MSVEEAEFDLSPSAVLETVQLERMRMLKPDMTKEESEQLDPKMRLETMRDLARTADQQIKNNVSRENNKEIAQALVNAAANRSHNPFRQVDAETGIPLADIPEVEPMPGEDSRDPSDMTYKNTYAGEADEE